MALRAGAAQRDISPIQPMQLAGYPHVRRISTGVHDPLLASALFLANGTQAILLCALDLLMLNADVTRRIRRRVAGQLGLPESGVFITCSHTHSAPVTLDYLPFVGDPAMPAPDPAYLQYCEDQIVIAALAAQGRAQPAELAWTTADAWRFRASNAECARESARWATRRLSWMTRDGHSLGPPVLDAASA